MYFLKSPIDQKLKMMAVGKFNIMSNKKSKATREGDAKELSFLFTHVSRNSSYPIACTFISILYITSNNSLNRLTVLC